MTIEHLREFLRNDPFVPFEIRMRNGDLYQVKERFQAAIGAGQFYVTYPDSDHIAFCPAEQIVSIEQIPVFNSNN